MQDLAQRTAFVLLLCLTALTVCAQEAGERRIIPVSVIDREGKLVEGLTPADFRGEFRGKPVKIHQVTWDETPRTVIILIDVSRSTADQTPTRELTWTAPKRLIELLAPNHKIVLMAFAEIGRYYGVKDGDQAEGSLETAIREYEANPRGLGTSTSLYDAIATAAQRDISGGSERATFGITDGIDTTSHLAHRELLLLLGTKNVRAYFLLLPPSADEDRRESRRGRELTKDIVESTGGGLIDLSKGIPKKSDPLAKLPSLAASITRHYLVDAEFQETLDKPRGWKLEVVDGSGKKRKDIEIAYPRLLVPLDSEKDKRKKE